MPLLEKHIALINKLGLHARASAKLVGLAERFEAEVYLVREDNQLIASAKSIMGLMMLGAAMGDSIVISAEGDGAETAVATLCELVEAKFGED